MSTVKLFFLNNITFPNKDYYDALLIEARKKSILVEAKRDFKTKRLTKLIRNQMDLSQIDPTTSTDQIMHVPLTTIVLLIIPTGLRLKNGRKRFSVSVKLTLIK